MIKANCIKCGNAYELHDRLMPGVDPTKYVCVACKYPQKSFWEKFHTE